MKAIPSGLVGRKRGMGLSSHTDGRGGQLRAPRASPVQARVKGRRAGNSSPAASRHPRVLPSPRAWAWVWAWAARALRLELEEGAARRRCSSSARASAPGRCGGRRRRRSGRRLGSRRRRGSGSGGLRLRRSRRGGRLRRHGGWARRGWRGRPSWGGSDDADGLWEGASSGRRHRRLRLRLRGRALRRLTCRRGRNADHGALLLRRDRIERMSEARGGVRVAA